MNNGKLDIIQDIRIGNLVEKHIALNENNKCILGFRVQIFFDSGSNSKNRAIATQNEFNTKHPNVEAYLMFKEPNFKVRVGDFRTRIDAQRLLHEIIGEYPNAFVVKDEVNFPRLD